MTLCVCVCVRARARTHTHTHTHTHTESNSAYVTQLFSFTVLIFGQSKLTKPSYEGSYGGFAEMVSKQLQNRNRNQSLKGFDEKMV